MQRILVIGATSAIAEAVLRLQAERGDALCLLARNEEHLAEIAGELATRGAARVEHRGFDVLDFAAHERVLEEAWTGFEAFDTVLLAHGSGSHERECLQSTEALQREFAVNATATVALMAQLALRMKRQGHGSIAVISSVAGDRGRATNLLYGSAKAAVSSYASGLRQLLFRHGVNVLTIKPGWISTPMTAHMRPNALFASPERIAPAILRAIDRRRGIVYVPWFWRPIAIVLQHVPQPLWKRLRF